jgi:multidrug efflux system membrane fusion protein
MMAAADAVRIHNAMNIRIPQTLQTVPAAVADFPERWQRATPRSRLIWAILAIAGALVLVWILVGLFTPVPVPKTPAAPVNVASAIRKTVIVSEQTAGTVVSKATVQITARVGGQLVSILFKEGDMVHKGQLLFELDPRPLQAAVEQAAAAMSRDQATLVSNQRDAVRYTTLAASGAASTQQRDQAVAAAKAMAATVISDKASLDAAKLNLIYSRIYSPVDGKTGPILIQQGNLITADATTPLVVITQLQPIMVSFFLPQTDLPQIQARMAQNAMQATIQVHGPGGEKLTAPVDFVGNAVSNQTGTIELRATFPNTDFALVPGALVDVDATLNQINNAVVVPRDAVNLGQNNSYVWLVTKDSKAQMQKVTVLDDDGTNDAIAGKVKPGDRVITDGALRVVQGSKVSIKKSLSTATADQQEHQQAPVGAQ